MQKNDRSDGSSQTLIWTSSRKSSIIVLFNPDSRQVLITASICLSAMSVSPPNCCKSFRRFAVSFNCAKSMVEKNKNLKISKNLWFVQDLTPEKSCATFVCGKSNRRVHHRYIYRREVLSGDEHALQWCLPCVTHARVYRHERPQAFRPIYRHDDGWKHMCLTFVEFIDTNVDDF